MRVLLFEHEYKGVKSVFHSRESLLEWLRLYFEEPDLDLGDNLKMYLNKRQYLPERGIHIQLYDTEEHPCPVCKGQGVYGFYADLCYLCKGAKTWYS